MMNSFKNWYVRNQDAITWFLIGWLSLSCINSLADGNLIWAAISAGIVWLNYSLRKVRM